MLSGGTEGNERLTVQAGACCSCCSRCWAITILRIGPLLWLHLFIGLLLIGPLAVKLASTGYRFARYYTHDAPLRAQGPACARPAGARARWS